MMAKTYTYTARSAEDPQRVVTFTLRDSRMSVGVGAPLEQEEQVIRLSRDQESAEEGEARPKEGVAEQKGAKLWLRPVAVSLVERGTRPVHVDDVVARLDGDWLQVRAWIRTGGLRLLPITLIDGRVDNAVAAQDFVEQVRERRTDGGLKPFDLFDYWATWVAGGLIALLMFRRWRRKGSEKHEA
jgi:hypothetical protein